TRSPASLAAIHAGSSGRVRRGSSILAAAILCPSRRPAKRPRSVSTSGSSGTSAPPGALPDRLQHDAPRSRLLAAELVRGLPLGGRRLGGRLVGRVDLGEHVPGGHRIPPLPAADD